MSAGVPVVASDRGSLPEVVGEAGLQIDPDDAESLVDAMAKLARDPALRAACAQRGLERARQFSWDRTARDVRRAYEEAVAMHSARTNPRRARAAELGANLDAHRD
jgi:glycosyltransferase involved in cell wall biosynthesis